ncbi:hypothetical protein OH77DRAFT_1428658 [Trametes cingulata]|nr:hypothetical protein OH77DRAFT_1428658 [Trametes cingulata]
MHQCLQIDEIVCMICSNLDGHDYYSWIACPTRTPNREASSLRSLAALARTCRALQGPALGVLWREIPDIFILVKYLMPDQLLHFDDASRTMFLTRPPSDSDWGRLDPYVQQIQAVGISVRPGVRPLLDRDSVLRPLANYLMRRTVEGIPFPNLAHVVYHPSWTDPLYSSLLLSPRLQTLQLPMLLSTSFEDWGFGPQVSYMTYSVVRQHLRELLAEHIRPAIRRTHRLRAIWLDGSILDAATLSHLGALTSLTTLALDCAWYSMSYAPRDKLHYRAFPSLTQLLLTPGPEGPEFLAHIDPVALCTVTVEWNYVRIETHTYGMCLQAIIFQLSHLKGLTRLTIIEPPEDSDAYERAGLCNGSMYLEPLLSMTSLRTLEISIDGVIQLDDAFLSTLARDFPFLDSLSLVPREQGGGGFSFEEISGGEDDVYLPSMDGLVTLVTGCQRLTKLGLAVEARFRGGRRPPRDVRCPSSVRSLNLWTTPLDPAISGDEFVDFFALAFPSLEVFYILLASPSVPDGAYADTTMKEGYARWDAVRDQLRNRLEGLRVTSIMY